MPDAVVLAASELPHLLALLSAGRELVGPTVRDGAVVLDRIAGIEDLPRGWRDSAQPGRYRIERTEDPRYFGFVVGPDSARKWLQPARLVLWRAKPAPGRGFVTSPGTPPPPPRTILGLRACDLAAVSVQDRVFLASGVEDPHYAARRSDVLLVAVQCGRSLDTCFCASMGTGPRATRGYDLLLTELLDDEGHRFVVEVGSDAGAEVVARLPVSPAGADASAPDRAAADAAAMQRRAVDAPNVREDLLAALESPSWDEVATRCLGCANCTLVCPTCFCTAVDTITLLNGESQQERRWDSCFHTDFSYVHGGPVRPELSARYRQWLTHKLATWYDQFGTSGCVGCGRCIAWCPAGIDLVAEAARYRTSRTEAPPEESP